jgi:hypothetical protein
MRHAVATARALPHLYSRRLAHPTTALSVCFEPARVGRPIELDRVSFLVGQSIEHQICDYIWGTFAQAACHILIQHYSADAPNRTGALVSTVVLLSRRGHDVSWVGA